MDLKSLRCIVSRQERVVVVRPTHTHTLSLSLSIYIYICMCVCVCMCTISLYLSKLLVLDHRFSSASGNILYFFWVCTIFWSISLSVHLSIYLCLFIIYRSKSVPLYLSQLLSSDDRVQINLSLSLCLSLCLSVSVSLSLFIYIYIYICQFISILICISVSSLSVYLVCLSPYTQILSHAIFWSFYKTWWLML